MNTVKELLELALNDGAPDVDRAFDPADDLLRGRRLLRRRRTGASVIAAAAAAAVLVGVVAGNAGADAPVASGGQHMVSTTPVPKGHRAIALVAFTGDQTPGYQVAEVPSGWVIQGGNQFALVIAPQNDPDTSIYSFVGKLVVMLQSDASPPTTGVPDPVNGQPGFFDSSGDPETLTYQLPDGRWVVIQAPAALGWDAAKIAQFASGVQVLGNAEQSQG